MLRFLRFYVPSSIFLLFVGEAIIALGSFCLGAYLTLEVDPTVFLLYDGGLERIAVVVGLILFGQYLQDLYSNPRIRSKVFLGQQLAWTIGLVFVLQGLVSYIYPPLTLPRRIMLSGSALCGLGLWTWRVVFAKVVINTVGRQKILFLGNSELIRDVIEQLQRKPHLGMVVLGYVDDQPGCLDGVKWLGPVSEIKRIAQELHPDKVVVGMRERRDRLPVMDLLELRFSGIHIEEVATTYEQVCGRIPTKELRPAQLIFSGELGPKPSNLMLQRLYSFFLAAAGLVLFSPLMLVIAVLIKATSKGPVLYKQERVGQHGKVFVLYKFRSMYEGAEVGSGPIWASNNDPRVTPVGRVLRRYRLDELPQLINVLKGEMSLVGPRPERPQFVRVLEKEIPFYRQRHAVKPGITGWAQVNFEYADSVEDTITKLEYDLYYIKNLSPALDAWILFETIKTVLTSRGAR